MKKEKILKRVVDALARGLEMKQMDVVIQVVKLLTFFSDDEVQWSQIICREVVKGCLASLATKDNIEKKFVLGLLCGNLTNYLDLYRYFVKSHHIKDF